MGNVKGSPRALKRSIKQLIYERATNSDKPREYLANEIKREIEDANEISPTIETLKKYISDYRNSGDEELDKPWDTANLSKNSIRAEAVPLLTIAQLQRRTRFMAKPLTIREALWFNRLYGFSYVVIFKSEELESDYDLFESFRINHIATWAQIYAYREKIDSVAGIKNPDYSDLDMVISDGDFHKLPASSDRLWDEARTFDFENKKSLQKFNSYRTLTAIDMIWRLEGGFLGYSLGTPDLIDDSLDLYFEVLITPTMSSESNPELVDLLESMTIKQRTQYLIDIRKRIKDDPNIADIEAEIKKVALCIKDGAK